MAIEVRSGGNPGAPLVASYAGGKGKERNKFSMAQAQTQARINENERNRRFSKNLEESRRDDAITDAETNRRFTLERDQSRFDQKQFSSQQDYERALERDQLNFDQKQFLSQQDYERAFERDQLNLLNRMKMDQFGSQLKRDDIVFEMDQTQRAEFNNLSKNYAAAVASGDFTEDELKVIRKETQQKQMGLQPTPRVKEPPQFAHGHSVGDEYVAKDGIPRVIDASGVPRVPSGWKPPESTGQISVSDISKTYRDVYNEMAEMSDDGKPADPKAVADEARNRLNFIKEFLKSFDPSAETDSGGAVPNVPGPGSLPPHTFDNYMKPGMESIGGAPAQAPGDEWALPGQSDIPAPTATPSQPADKAPDANKWKIN
ncbi:MAG: hypothetical protein R6V06_02560 [Kiritimatiellia bacterium]